VVDKNQNLATVPGGGLPCERDGDAHRKIRIKTLKETNLVVAQAFLTPKGDYAKQITK